MSKPMRTGPAAAPGPGGLPPDSFTAGHGHAVAAWMAFNQAILEGIGKLQQETGRFVAQRLEDDMARQQRLLACRSPQDFWQACAEHAQQAVQDYSAEAGRLSEIAAEVQYACGGYGEMLAGEVLAGEATAAPRRDEI